MNIMGKKNMPSINTRGISIRTKILAFTITMIVVSNLILGLGTFAYSKNLIFEQVQNKAMNIANDAARFTDGDELERIEEISPDNETVVKYSNTYLKLSSEIGASYIYVFMLDDKGEPFFGATSDIAESSDSIGEGFEMYPGMQKAFDGEMAADDEATTDEWGTFLSGYSPVFNSAGQVVGIVGADIEYSELLKKLDNLRLRIFAMYMVIATILVIGCLIISKLLKNGFYILNSKVEELADGSGDLNREVEIKSGDEFETVAESINHFIGEVRALAETVARETDESAETVNRINESVTELSANIEECSATSETISDRLEDTANNVKQMAAMVRNIDDKVMEASGKALKESESALAHKEEATISIQKIQNDVRNATERAKAVDRVQVTAAEIQRIAAETRILALNAQLEAARAGSYGRGFAVVASEMEALNEQIANAVAEITEVNETVIESVNELIGGTVKIDKYLTENVLPDYDDYAKLGREYGEMANFISKDMSVLTSHTDKVADEVETINIGVRDISRAVADSANQVTMVSSISHSIVENMDRLTDNSMLKMVKT